MVAPLPRAPLVAIILASVLATISTTGCASRQPAPVLPPVAVPPPETKARPRTTPPLTEENVTPETPPLRVPGATTPEGSEAETPAPSESLLAMIQPTTPPHVAAATRLVERGREQLAGGNSDAAIESLERAIAIDPNNPYAYYFLAESHFARGTYDQAVVFADKAALLSARIDPSWLSRSYCLQGRIFEASGRFPDARASYAQALEADGGNRTAREGLARVGGLAPVQP